VVVGEGEVGVHLIDYLYFTIFSSPVETQ
jgi:hypothetical protein